MPKTASTTRTDAARNPLKDRNPAGKTRRSDVDDIDVDPVSVRRKGVDTVTGIDELDDETPGRYQPGHPNHRAAEVAEIAGTPEHRHDLRALTRNAVTRPPKRTKARKPTARRKPASSRKAAPAPKRAATSTAKKRAAKPAARRKAAPKRRGR